MYFEKVTKKNKIWVDIFLLYFKGIFKRIKRQHFICLFALRNNSNITNVHIQNSNHGILFSTSHGRSSAWSDENKKYQTLIEIYGVSLCKYSVSCILIVYYCLSRVLDDGRKSVIYFSAQTSLTNIFSCLRVGHRVTGQETFRLLWI